MVDAATTLADAAAETANFLSIMEVENILRQFAYEYNSLRYFEEDPIIFPRHFAELYKKDEATLQDVEISGIVAAHLAWGRRSMIVRDCRRAFDEMNWQPADYVSKGVYRDEDISLHRTVKWCDFAAICKNLHDYYSDNESIETLSADDIRVRIYGQKSNPKAANKKIHMFRRWMVRNDGIVDFGVWKNTDPRELVIPLDVHVHRVALEMGLTSRKQADFSTAREITDKLLKIFPEDPCKGDFALFAYGVSRNAVDKKTSG